MTIGYMAKLLMIQMLLFEELSYFQSLEYCALVLLLYIEDLQTI